MKFDPFTYRYSSCRNLVYGSRGMTATSNPLAAAAGMDMLKKGGNAVDAAIATAAALSVVEPVSNGIGSDAFAMVWSGGRLRGINGSGRSPFSLGADRLRDAGLSGVSPFGWTSVTTPGAPGTWAELSESLGRLSLAEVLAPAVEYARGGYAVSVNVSRMWKRALRSFAHLEGPLHSGWFAAFCPDGRAPEPGDKFASEDMARTLEAIGATGARDFYSGDIAGKILSFSRDTGGFFSKEDLESFSPEWTDPIHIGYKGWDVWEMPPNGQGITALIALGILRGFDLSSHDSPDAVHKQIEALKLAFADAERYVADPDFAKVPVEELLSESYLAARRGKIGDLACAPEAGDPYSGGTVYLCTADGEGNMVSYIQSNFRGFGSGVVVPGTGISLNNRGLCFSAAPGHPNELAGGKRPYNTIIPGFITKDGSPVGPFGVMGGYMQPQGHVQVVVNCVDFGMNPQEALDAPRWQWTGGLGVSFEPGFANSAVQSLERSGHSVSIASDPYGFGRGEIIRRTEKGCLVGATEPRTDGSVEAW
ncbi:MAG: gamma-glutamyltransferase family protein [Synergistaceae bacterium]|nr:gamma-glutamyltransferase family protein [Synergistaceae bacterium]